MNCEICELELNKNDTIIIDGIRSVCTDCFITLYDRELTREIKYKGEKSYGNN